MVKSPKPQTQTQTRARKPSPDGISRPAKAHAQIASLAVDVFGTPSGAEFLGYLRSQTIEQVAGPAVDPNQLMHLEGQRFLVGLIEAWIKAGHEVKNG